MHSYNVTAMTLTALTVFVSLVECLHASLEHRAITSSIVWAQAEAVKITARIADALSIDVT